MRSLTSYLRLNRIWCPRPRRGHVVIRDGLVVAIFPPPPSHPVNTKAHVNTPAVRGGFFCGAKG